MPWIILVTALLIGGCGGATTARFSPDSAAPALAPHEGEVQVLDTMPPKGTFRRLGVVVVDGIQLATKSAMFDALRDEAAAAGANAVVLQGPMRTTQSAGGSKQHKLAAWAIRIQ